MKKMVLIFALVCILGFASAARAEWEFSLGTGLAAMKAEGDMGFNVAFAGIGPVTAKLDLAPADFNEYMKSAFGLAGTATDGKWMIQYAFSTLELEDEPATRVGANTVAADLSFKITTGELTVGYPFFMNESVVLRGYTGFRYLKHEMETKVLVNGSTRINRTLDNNWTDVLVGVSSDVPFAENWVWNTKLDGGFAGSEGSFYLNTGVKWMFAEHWATGLFAQYYAIDFENGNKGDADWYLYDIDESCLGLKIAYVW